MTEVQISTTPLVATTQLVNVTLHLAANIRTAQHAGDLAYDEAQSQSLTLEDCADAYHAAYIETMRAMGTPAICNCCNCAGERGDMSY